MTYFNNTMIAEGYRNKRPNVHPIIVDKIKKEFKIDQKLKNALDVGCGTGLSTIALKSIAENVIGTDISKEMINLAQKKENVKYFNYSAEELPFKKNTFDLITLAGSINWIDRDIFLKIARNILIPKGYLVIYDNYFMGQMENNEDFQEWHENIFTKRYPKPPRNNNPITKEEADKYNFNFIRDENYTNEIEMSLKEYVDYTTTLTEITTIVEKNPDKLFEIKSWLEEQLKIFFNNSRQIFIFGGYIWYFNSLDES